MVTENLVLLAGDYDARFASRNMELIDLDTLESTEITVRDYHPGKRFREINCKTLCEMAQKGIARAIRYMLAFAFDFEMAHKRNGSKSRLFLNWFIF